jgi:hypothetical protein
MGRGEERQREGSRGTGTMLFYMQALVQKRTYNMHTRCSMRPHSVTVLVYGFT